MNFARLLGYFRALVLHPRWSARRVARLGELRLLRAAARILPKLGEAELRAAFDPVGFELIKNHYYSPLPLKEDLDDAFFARSSDMTGVEIDGEEALRFARTGLAPYLEEFRGLFGLCEPKAPGEFHLLNGTFMAGDAPAYYAMIRHFRPRRIVEIGAGSLTLVAIEACRENEGHGAPRADLVAVEPYPNGAIARRALQGDLRLIPQKVQAIDPELWQSLGENDILFIDSSHVLASGNDVQHEYLEILPRLRTGVLVHVHDVSLPKPYPKAYLRMKYYWNEQYLLQAFLAFNWRFETLWPASWLMSHHGAEMAALFPEIADMRRVFPEAEPSSFWMRVKKP